MAVLITQTANPSGAAASSNVSTYSGVSIGTAAANRIVVVLVGSEVTNGTINSCTIDYGSGDTAMSAGTAATQGVVRARAFYLAVPTGTTATIKVTYGADPTGNQNHIAVYSVTGAAISSVGGHNSTDMDANAPLTTGSISIASGGGFLAVAVGATDTVGKTWNNATEDIDADAGSHRFTTATRTTELTTTAITCTGGTNGEDGAMSWIIFTANASPTVALNTPADAGTTSDTTPTLDFTGTDNESQDVRYNIQIDTVNTFDSSSVTSATRVQTKTAPSSGYATSVTATMDSNFTAGNLVVVAITYNNDTAGVVNSVSDGTNTYTLIQDGTTSADTQGELWYAYNVAAASAVTATMSANSHDMAIIVREYSGVLASADPLDKSAEQASTSGTTHTSAATATTTQAYELVVAMMSFGANTTFTAGTGYANLAQQNASDIYEAVALEDKDITTTQTVTASFTTSGSGGGYVAVATFKLADGSLIDDVSGTDSGFANPDNGGDTDPFTSGENIQYTVQSALSAGTYYWRVRGIDPSGANTYGAWSSSRSFTIEEARRRLYIVT